MGRGEANKSESEALATPREEWVSLGSICNGRLIYEQTQYVSHFLGGHGNSPDLSKSIRFQGNRGDYHSMKIHTADTEEFARRVNHYRDLTYHGKFAEAEAFVASL